MSISRLGHITGRICLSVMAVLLLAGCTTVKRPLYRGDAKDGPPAPPGLEPGKWVAVAKVPSREPAVHPLALAEPRSGQPGWKYRGAGQTPATEPHRVTDASGSWSGNQEYQTLSAVGQGTPVGETRSDAYINRSGYLNSFILYASLDTDGDGIANEDDRDDDGDGLMDLTELRGTAFGLLTPTDSLNADSDGDGVTDGEEVGMGSNPLDDGSALKVADVGFRDGKLSMVFNSREGYRYEVIRSSTLGDLANGEVVQTITATGGSGPWGDTRTEIVIQPVSPPEFFGVRLAE